MKQINYYAFFLFLWDILRFGILGIFLLPAFATSFSIVDNPSSNYRLLLWLAAPQLIIPSYLGAVALGFTGDTLLKHISLVVKSLSLVPGLAALIIIIFSNMQQTGSAFSDFSELQMILRLSMVMLFDLVFCIMALAYRRKQPEQEI